MRKAVEFYSVEIAELADGTFSVLEEGLPAMRSALDSENPLVVIGGPIATYLSDRILEEIAPDDGLANWRRQSKVVSRSHKLRRHLPKLRGSESSSD